MSEQTTPSLVRLKRVHYFLGKDPTYKPRLEAAPVRNFVKEVREGSGKSPQQFPFPQPVWDVAQVAINAGFDPAAMDRATTIAWAAHALDGAAKPENGVVTAAVEPTTKAPPATETSAKTTNLGVDLPIRVAILTQLVAAAQLSESFDRKPGAEALRAKINAALDECLQSVNAKPIQPA